MRQLKPKLVIMAAIKPILYGLMISWLTKVRHPIVLMTGLGRLYTYQDRMTKLLCNVSTILYRLILPLARHIFFQNQDDQQLFIDLKLTTLTQSSITFGSGVNLKQFFYTPLPSQQTLKFLFIGRLLKSKGIYEYCDAAKRLYHLYPHCCFQVLGGFDSKTSSSERTHLDQLFSSKAIEYLGEQPTILPYLQAAHVVVLPSYYREGIPKSLLEALSVGRAIITTDAPGCRETVVDGQNGYLVLPQNLNSLEQALLKIITQPHLIDEMGRASRQLAQLRFDVDIVNRLILEKIDSLEKLSVLE